MCRERKRVPALYNCAQAAPSAFEENGQREREGKGTERGSIEKNAKNALLCHGCCSAQRAALPLPARVRTGASSPSPPRPSMAPEGSVCGEKRRRERRRESPREPRAANCSFWREASIARATGCLLRSVCASCLLAQGCVDARGDDGARSRVAWAGGRVVGKGDRRRAERERGEKSPQHNNNKDDRGLCAAVGLGASRLLAGREGKKWHRACGTRRERRRDGERRRERGEEGKNGPLARWLALLPLPLPLSQRPPAQR